MPNHIHLLWCGEGIWTDKNLEQVFLRYTAQQLKFLLLDTGAHTDLEHYKSTQADRAYIFGRDAMAVLYAQQGSTDAKVALYISKPGKKRIGYKGGRLSVFICSILLPQQPELEFPDALYGACVTCPA